MGKETVKTRNWYNMFEISSLIQKALRRRDAEMAYFAANELIPHYRNYLWKRLLTVSAEDCYDMVTGRIMELHNLDVSQPDHANRKYIAVAVSTLLNARKNRDGDYFACNLLNSRDKADISKYVPNPVFDITCSTKNGHCLYDLAECFDKSIDALDDVMSGYAANEIRVYYPNFCWNMIIRKAQSLGYDKVVCEMKALKAADEQTKRTSIIFYSKALTILLKVVKYGNADFYNHDFAYNDTIDLKSYDNKRFAIPEYVYDCHTYKGKAMKKTKEMFVVDEQAALTPHKQGEYDNCSWEHYFWLCKNGFWTEEYTPHPGKERIAELEKGNVQLNLF